MYRGIIIVRGIPIFVDFIGYVKTRNLDRIHIIWVRHNIKPFLCNSFSVEWKSPMYVRTKM
jgi:hypothetical protein